MPFSFRLESILNWKRSLEESSQMRLAEKMKQLKTVEEEIRQLISERFESDRQLREKMTKGIQVGEVLVHKQFGESRYQDLLIKEGKRKERLSEVETERERLTGLMKERKMLERLKEKKLRKYSTQMEKLAQKANDELVTTHYRSDQKLIPYGELTLHERSSEMPPSKDS
jgi:flagellar protein FliJ